MKGLESIHFIVMALQNQSAQDTNLAYAQGFGSGNAIDSAESASIDAKIATTQKLIDLKTEEMRVAEESGGIMSDKYTQAALAVNKLQQEMVGLSVAQQRVGSLSDQVGASLRDWAQSVGSTFHQIAGILTTTIKSAFSGVANALTSVIMGTQSASAAFSQMALQMATSFIASVIEMILIATVAIPILTALGILSGGATVSTGVAATTAGLAAGASMAGTYATYAEGGLIPGPASTADTIPAWLSTGEHVTRAAAVSYYGAGMLAAINDMSIPRDSLYAAVGSARYRTGSTPSHSSHYADGGLVGTVPSSGATVNVAPAAVNVAVLKDRNEIDRYFESTAGKKMIVQTFKGNRRAMGQRS